jgi:hypothetical protein
MHSLLPVLLALQVATVVDLYKNSETIVSVQIGNVIYSAEFPPAALKADSFSVGDRVRADVKNGRMTVKRKDGKKVTAPVIQIQRILVHPKD